MVGGGGFRGGGGGGSNVIGVIVYSGVWGYASPEILEFRLSENTSEAQFNIIIHILCNNMRGLSSLPVIKMEPCCPPPMIV